MVDDDGKLAALLPRITAADWIALDTEADSLHAYPEKLCLLQISLPGADVIIDPLAEINLAPLFDALKNRELILHGADYDLRLLWKSFQFRPSSIFDTMWAARLLGLAEFGLTHLVARELKINLEKGPQKMNWARRPLTERMEAYARNDTRYLRPLSQALAAELQNIGRLPWLLEICSHVIDECSQDRILDPEMVWRVKGSDRLGRKALAILRELWQWREEEARERNKPPYFILSHEKLVAFAAAASEGKAPEELCPMNFQGVRRAQLVAAMERGLQVPASAQPKPPKNTGRRLTQLEQDRFEQLKARRDRRAEELKLDPSLIASRAELVALAVDWEGRQSAMMSWQRELLRDAG